MLEVSSGAHWYLEGSVDGVSPPTRFKLRSFPARIGRQRELEVVLPVPHVSGVHAEIFEREGTLWIRDAGSSNGTRLNQASVNVEWKTPLPGLGHSSPIVWEDRIFLTTAVSADPDAIFVHGLDGRIDRRSDRAEQSFRVFSLSASTVRRRWSGRA